MISSTNYDHARRPIRRDLRAGKELLNDQQIVDLTAVAGTYVMVAMCWRWRRRASPPGKEPPFKAGE